MKYLCKYAALLLALSLCLTTLVGCARLLPFFGVETPSEQQGQEQNPGEGEQTQQPEQPEEKELLSDSITCCDGETTLRFEKNAEGLWQWKDDPTFPLDTTYVDALAASVQKILAAQPIVTDQTQEDLELDSQQKYVTVTDEKGYRMTWYLGDKDDNGCYYLCLAGDATNSIYLAPAELTEQISRSIYDMMILPQLPAMTADHITKVTITTAEKVVTTTRNSAGVWVVGNSSVTATAQPMIQGLSLMQIAGCVDFKPLESVPAICGLEPPQATVAVEFTSSTGVESSLSFSAGAKLNRGYCVTLEGDSTIYLVKHEVLDPLFAFMK